eukprot:3958009-Amphidinium_carterae.1
MLAMYRHVDTCKSGAPFRSSSHKQETKSGEDMFNALSHVCNLPLSLPKTEHLAFRVSLRALIAVWGSVS